MNVIIGKRRIDANIVMVYSIVMADELYLKSPEAQLESPADTIHSYLIATTMITADSNIKGLL